MGSTLILIEVCPAPKVHGTPPGMPFQRPKGLLRRILRIGIGGSLRGGLVLKKILILLSLAFIR